MVGKTNHQSGHEAEQIAAKYLETNKFTILDINWRTQVCEIDIVAKKKSTIYFIEVKYRSTNYQGGGLDYITPKKFEQMQFAARCWVEEHKYSGQYDLGALEMSADYEITEFIESID